MPGGGEGSGGRTLADMIFDKMGGGSAPAAFDDGWYSSGYRILADVSDAPPDPRQGLNPKVVEVYTKYVEHYIRPSQS